MDFSWTPDQDELRQAVVKFASAELVAGDGSEAWFRRCWQRCASLGIQGLAAPVEFGGTDADSLTVVAALEALGYACPDNGLIFSLHAQMWAVQHPLARFGTPEQQRRYFPGLCDGTIVGAHGMSEPDSGSDAFALATAATPVAEGYRLSGMKTFVTNAPVADVFVIFARKPGTKGFSGLTAFLVDADTPGVSVSQPMRKMGLTSSPMGEVFLDDCLVPAENVLGRPGGGMPIFVAAMERERGMILASSIGTMERNVEQCVEYAKSRRQFGQAIGKFQAVSHRLVEMKLRLETSRLLLYRLAWLLDQEQATGLDSALAKLHLSESYVATALDALQVHGGYGYMAEFGIEREVRDALASRLYSGTSDIQRNIAARAMGL